MSVKPASPDSRHCPIVSVLGALTALRTRRGSRHVRPHPAPVSSHTKGAPRVRSHATRGYVHKAGLIGWLTLTQHNHSGLRCTNRPRPRGSSHPACASLTMCVASRQRHTTRTACGRARATSLACGGAEAQSPPAAHTGAHQSGACQRAL